MCCTYMIFLIYFLSVYEKQPRMFVPLLRIHALHLAKDGSGGGEGVAWASQLFAFSCEGLAAVCYRSKEGTPHGLDQPLLPSVPRGPSAQQEAGCSQ